MTMRCSICTHPQADEINRLLAQGAPLRDIVGQVPDISKSALHRHRAHVALLLVAAKTRADEATGSDALAGALQRLDDITHEAARLARTAERRGNLRIAAELLVNQAVRLVELTARLKGLLQSGGSQVQVGVAVTAEPSRQAVERAAVDWIGQVLADVPDLRQQVADHLTQRRQARVDVEMAAIRMDRVRMGLLDREGAQATEPDPPTVLRPSPDAEGQGPGGSWELYLPRQKGV